MTKQAPPPRTQTEREFWLSAILAIGTFTLVAIITIVVLLKEIPARNEILIGTVLGFIFGNMTGPVFRKFFAGPDAQTSAATDKHVETLKSAVDKLPPSAPEVLVVEAEPADPAAPPPRKPK